MRIGLVTTCRGRLEHLRKTLPENLHDSRGTDTVCVVLNYNDQDGMDTYFKTEHKADLESGRLVYYKNSDAPRFHMGHAKNQAMRCAMNEGVDILVTLDADNFASPGFVQFIAEAFSKDKSLSYLFPDFGSLPSHAERWNPDKPRNLRRGFAGRLAIRTQDFIKIGGYNEIFEMWGAEDIDILARLERLGLKRGHIPSRFLDVIPHGPEIRFREWPEAKANENDNMVKKCRAAHDTVVNYGRIGCGILHRNFSDTLCIIEPMATRVFGIGLQRTGTTSLQHAFERLGYDTGHWKSGEWAKTIWQEMNRWDRSRVMEQDYALCDNPLPMLYQKLDKSYPNSKFILTVRNEDDWIKSIEKFWTPEGNRRRWTWDTDGFSHRMHGIIYGRADFDKQVFLDRYRRHNHEVMEYFRGRHNFFRIDIHRDTRMSGLCQFLGHPIIDELFPHSNRG